MSATDSIAKLAELGDLPRAERVQRLFNFEPTDYQAKLLNFLTEEPRAHAAPKAGRQVGKTLTAGVIGADHAVNHDGTDVLFAAPAQSTANEMFRGCKQHFRNGPFTLEQYGVTKDNEKTWEFDTGTRILSRTLGNVEREDNPANRGMNPTCVIVDEAAYEKDAVYTQEIEEFFITHPEYEYCLFSTPAGKSGYFYEKVEHDDEWYSPHWRTEISPFAQQDYIKKKRRQLDNQTFRQEFLGEFVESEGAYLPHSLVAPCFGTKPEPSGRLYLGVDVARKGDDRTVYTEMDAAGVADVVDTEDESTVPGIVGRIQNLHNERDYDRILVDENAVGGGVVDFSERGLGGVVKAVPFTVQTKHEMYTRLKRDFESRDIKIPNHRRLLDELTSLMYDFTPSGKVKVEARNGEHDDHPDSLALANYGRTQIEDSRGRRNRGRRPR